VLVTTSVSFSEWASVFDGAKIAMALLDRFAHRCHIVETANDDYRCNNSQTQPRKERQTTKKTPSGLIPAMT
jgi:DNA replication protein DnaC